MTEKVIDLICKTTKFSVGDAVKLRHVNSPKMVINELRGNNKALCVWFDSDYNAREHVFNLEILAHV